MKLILHTPEKDGALSKHYHRAFREAKELFIVTAYLTDWDSSLKLNSRCRSFRMITGKDFGITRKAALEAVMRWLPARWKSQFLVADLIDGFHPKALFWSTGTSYHTVVGSSNLTKAAFETNYEANIYSEVSETDFLSAKAWVKHLESRCIAVSPDWVLRYREAIRPNNRRSRGLGMLAQPLIPLKLPNPKGTQAQVAARQKQLAAYLLNRNGLVGLFKRCANRKITSLQFYDQLPRYWSYEVGDRFQGRGWERQGRNANFRLLAQSYLKILQASDADRDDVVAAEMDGLAKRRVPTRKAFLSEMLSLEFPADYPVLNDPVYAYLSDIKFRGPSGASDGARYIDLAKRLRFSLLQNPKHVAKNLAELDIVIWLAYGRK